FYDPSPTVLYTLSLHDALPIWVLALVFTAFALAGPQWGYEWQEVKTEGREIIFALDTSKSMLAADIKPSRLDRAKLAIKDLVATDRKSTRLNSSHVKTSYAVFC